MAGVAGRRAHEPHPLLSRAASPFPNSFHEHNHNPVSRKIKSLYSAANRRVKLTRKSGMIFVRTKQVFACRVNMVASLQNGRRPTSSQPLQFISTTTAMSSAASLHSASDLHSSISISIPCSRSLFSSLNLPPLQRNLRDLLGKDALQHQNSARSSASCDRVGAIDGHCSRCR